MRLIGSNEARVSRAFVLLLMFTLWYFVEFKIELLQIMIFSVDVVRTAKPKII